MIQSAYTVCKSSTEGFWALRTKPVKVFWASNSHEAVSICQFREYADLVAIFKLHTAKQDSQIAPLHFSWSGILRSLNSNGEAISLPGCSDGRAWQRVAMPSETASLLGLRMQPTSSRLWVGTESSLPMSRWDRIKDYWRRVPSSRKPSGLRSGSAEQAVCHSCLADSRSVDAQSIELCRSIWVFQTTWRFL